MGLFSGGRGWLRDGLSRMETRRRCGVDDRRNGSGVCEWVRETWTGCACCSAGACDESGSGDADRYEEGGDWRADVGSGVGQDCGGGAAAGDAFFTGAAGCAAILSAIFRDERGG